MARRKHVGRLSERLWFPFFAFLMVAVAAVSGLINEWSECCISLVGAAGWIAAGTIAWRRTHPDARPL